MTVLQRGVAVTFGAPVQGAKVLSGTAAEALVASATPCNGIWIGAPTAAHTQGANSGTVMVGFAAGAAGANLAGGRPLTNDNYDGFLLLVDDASKVYIEGASGDGVEYQIYK